MICHPGYIVSTMSGEGVVLETLSSDFAGAPIGVFWLTNDCGVPIAFDFFQVVENIRKSLWDCNHKGRAEIRAYGYEPGFEECVGNDINFEHGVIFSPFLLGEESDKEAMLKNNEAMQKKLFVDILAWTLHNPSPAHILFIANDMTLHNYGLLFKMKLEGYNILLGKLPKPDPRIIDCEFCHIRSTIWNWKRLSHGQFPLIVSLPRLGDSKEAHLDGVISINGTVKP